MMPNFQPHSEGLPASLGVLFALHLGYTFQDPPNPLAHQCHQLQERSTWKPEGSTHPVLTTPKGHVCRSAGKARVPQPPSAYPWMQGSPSRAGQCSANACSARDASLQLAGSLPHPVLGALLPGAFRAPTQSAAGIHTNRPCSGTCTLAEACTGAPHCNLLAALTEAGSD